MTSRRLGFLGFATVGSVLAGCSSITPSAQTAARIGEKTAVYQTLTPQQQEAILGGAIERGNTTDQVYMALGKPQRIVSSADARKAMWVYVEYYLPNTPMRFGFDPTHAAAEGGYATRVTAANTPFRFPDNPGYKGVKPQNFAGTSSQFSQTLDVPDLHSKTVYVFFFNGRVAEIKLDGDSSDQVTGAPNTAQAKDS